MAGLACLVALGSVFLTVGVAPVDAAPKGAVGVFGESGAGDGQFSFPAGVAVNQTSGDVYVVDVFNERVQQFDAEGVFVRAWGVAGSAEGEFFFGGNNAGIAVASDGSVYVADASNNRVQQFAADGAFVRMWGFGVQTGAEVFEICASGCQPGIAPSDPSSPGDGQLSNPIAVAVNPTDGDVVVADQFNNRIQRFDASGMYEAQFATPSPQSVAVDSTGAVYAVEQFGGGPRKFAADGTAQEFAYENANQIFSVAVDPESDHVFATQWHFNDVSGDFEGSEVIELDAAGEIIDQHRFRADLVETYGIAVRSDTGRIYVAQTFEDRVFILGDPVQTATVEPATDVESRTATLNGTVNPGGGLPMGYHFDVSADDGDTWTPFPETDIDVGDSTGDIAVTQPATGLEPGREYQVRLVVRNEFGSTFISAQTPDSTFTTDPEPPDVTTLNAIQLRPTGALLTGEINPNNAQTTYHFEYGQTNAYGTSIPIPDANAGSGGTPITVTQEINDLQPDTTYHYRLTATNTAGPTDGTDRTFRTRPLSPADTTRAYELVSPANKIGGVGVGHWYGGPDAVGYVGMPAHDGERFAVRSQNGSTIAPDGAFAYVNDWAFAERTPQGWVHRPAVSRRAHAPQPTTDITLSTSAPDLSLTAWSSAQILKLFPEMADWDETVMGTALMLRKWADPQWELFGPTDPSQDIPGSGEIATGPRVIAADGSAAVASGPGTRGLTGPDDPSLDLPDLDAPGAPGDPSSIYLDETAGAFSDTFPGDDGIRELVNVCTGSGLDRTVLPSGPCPDPPPNRDAQLTSPGGASLMSGTSGGSPPASVISADGSRVFFMSPDPTLSGFGPAQLFVRQRGVDGQVKTRWISRTEVTGQDPSLRAPALFEGASRDGDKVFFRTTSPLTVDDPNGEMAGQPSAESADLYMYDLPDGPDGKPATPDGDPAGGDLTRISAGPNADGDCNVQTGALRWVSDEASRAYFTCAAPLSGTPDASNGTTTSPDGTTAADDASNLYLYDSTVPTEPSWSFIARLPRDTALGECATRAVDRGSTIAAKPGGTGNDFSINDFNSCVRGAADGSLVTFFTDGRLTSDDPDTASGDVYAYDLENDELTRVSAPRGGAGGVGSDYPCLPGSAPLRCHGDGGFGTGAMALEMAGVAGRLGEGPMAFFESRIQLVAEDTDDAYDVYQWRHGELSLISTGVSDTDGAFYVGNDRSGLNVYFATRDQLTWQDRDRVLDVYTARVGGGIPEPQPQPPCPPLADGCRSGGAPPTRPQVDAGPGDPNASPGPRKRLALRRPTSAQLKRAARTGKISLRVRTSAAGTVSISARAKLAGRTRVVGRASKAATKPGLVKVSLRLSAGARAVLRRGRPLPLTLRVTQAGAKPRSMSVRLRRNDR